MYLCDLCGTEFDRPNTKRSSDLRPDGFRELFFHLTCATDPAVIPMYLDVFVQYADGTIEQLWATDTGVKGNHIDIYIEDYDAAIQNGRQTLNVWFLPPEGG